MSYVSGLGQSAVGSSILSTAESFPGVGPLIAAGALSYDAYEGLNAPATPPAVPQVAAPMPETSITLPSPTGTGVGPIIPTTPVVDPVTGQVSYVSNLPAAPGKLSGTTVLLIAAAIGGALALSRRR